MMRPEICCVVFDFDGTLVDSNPIKRGAYDEVTRRFGNVRALVDETLGVARGDRAANLREILLRLDQEQMLPREKTFEQWLAVLVEDYTTLCEASIVACPAIPGALEALDRLSAGGCPLYTNSATPTEPLARLLRLRQMSHFFRGIYGATATKVENLESIRREVGLPFDAILVVGDGEEDRLAAEKTGCPFFGVASQGGGFSVPPAMVSPNLFSLPNFVMQGVTP